MLSFFKRKGGKADATAGATDATRKIPNADATNVASVDARAPRNENDITNEKSNTLRKDVVNLLLPETNYNYNQKSGISGLLDMMAGKRKKNKKKTERTESCRVSPQREMQNVNLQRSKSDLDSRALERADVRDDVDDVAVNCAKNTQDDSRPAEDPADFVKALVLQKYSNKPIEAKPQHVSLVYVSNEPDLDEKQRAEALLREIAKSIDCTIDKINVNKEQMGTTESKSDTNNEICEPIYETIPEKNNSIDSYKNELREELSKLLKSEAYENNIKSDLGEDKKIDLIKYDRFTESTESLFGKKKSNLKPPRSESEGCSDDDRSDCGKKKVTFRKHIIFDDGEQQTDEEIDSSFETISSGSSDEEDYLDDSLPDNDESLGGVVVSRNENDNKTVINVQQTEQSDPIKIKIECLDNEITRISSENSDSGFIEISDKLESANENCELKVCNSSDSDSSASGSEDTEEEDEEEIVEENPEIVDSPDLARERLDKKSLVSQESKFQSQVAALTELADTRCSEAERTRELIAVCRKQIEKKDQEIERLKCDLEAAYKESELIRQRSRSLEEELVAARACSADLAEQLQTRNDESIRQIKAELEDTLTRRAELESKVLELERDRDRLLQEKALGEQRAQEAIAAAEADTAKWRSAHEAARSQAAARAERMLADCEWKMRELEKRARDAEKHNKEVLTQTVEQLKTAPPSASHIAELQQLRGLASEQQRSVQALTLQLQKVETREEALKLEVHRLKDLLDKESKIAKEKEDRHLQTVERLQLQHTKDLESLKADHASAAAASRAALERLHAERTRAALAQLRAEAEQDAKNADRKLREVTSRYDNLKEVLANKERQFEQALSEARSKADWDIMQLRHLLDKADITYANNVEKMSERFDKEKELLTKEWEEKLRIAEEEAAKAANEARKLLEQTRSRLINEKNDQINKLKNQHRLEMDDQWEKFMTDKENCLARMKTECRQEGEEERVKREKELLEEIAELRAEMQSKTVDYEKLEVKAAACGRTLAVTEQELKEALAREKELREKRCEDATKIQQVERASREQIEHLTRKCACLRKLFDDMRTRLTTREQNAEQESRAKDKEIRDLKAEVARLTKILIAQSPTQLCVRTRADGCEMDATSGEVQKHNESTGVEPLNTTRRKGGTSRTPEAMRKRLNLPDLQPLPPEARRTTFEEQNGRRRSNSVDLPAVQVPVRIKQLEGKLEI